MSKDIRSCQHCSGRWFYLFSCEVKCDIKWRMRLTVRWRMLDPPKAHGSRWTGPGRRRETAWPAWTGPGPRPGRWRTGRRRAPRGRGRLVTGKWSSMTMGKFVIGLTTRHGVSSVASLLWSSRMLLPIQIEIAWLKFNCSSIKNLIAGF